MKKIIGLIILAVFLSSCSLVDSFKQGMEAGKNQKPAPQTEIFNLEFGDTKYFHSIPEGRYNISVDSIRNIDINIFRSPSDFQSYMDGEEDVDLYDECSALDTKEFNKICSLDGNSLLAVTYFGPASTRVILKFTKLD
ncbi:hypothetical protein KY343_04670 [Candidatus Woesearchaeota archaeon]|nr:hypothetical protein [Candidatus Woesearchaeota archaeon]